MSCLANLLEPYLDEELDAAQRAAVERHVVECAECSKTVERLRAQRASIRAGAPYYGAPAGLRESIRGGLRRAAASRPEAPARALPWRGLAIAASVLLAVSVSWNLVQSGRRTEGGIAEAVITGHIRSLAGTHLLDVPSSDQHTVKPWFAGKLDFAPDVKDLSSEGFPLEGGRVEYLEGRRVAALIFHRRQHIINLFTWPSGSNGGSGRVARDGYNVVHWARGGMTYWAVSDVSAPELERFRNLYEQ